MHNKQLTPQATPQPHHVCNRLADRKPHVPEPVCQAGAGSPWCRRAMPSLPPRPSDRLSRACESLESPPPLLQPTHSSLSLTLSRLQPSPALAVVIVARALLKRLANAAPCKSAHHIQSSPQRPQPSIVRPAGILPQRDARHSSAELGGVCRNSTHARLTPSLLEHPHPTPAATVCL